MNNSIEKRLKTICDLPKYFLRKQYKQVSTYLEFYHINHNIVFFCENNDKLLFICLVVNRMYALNKKYNVLLLLSIRAVAAPWYAK